MKDNTYKITIILITITSVFIIMLNTILNLNYLKEYDRNENVIIASIISNLEKEYPNISDEEIAKILNTENLSYNEELLKYNIDIKNDSISLANKKIIQKILITDTIILLIYLTVIIIYIVIYRHKKDEKINEILKYLREINNKNYQLDIDTNTEDELSILKNEIYKTAIMLNEQDAKSKREKDSLKDSLSDISHQIKTPLTSINLMIDNLIDNKNLSKKEQKELIMNIRHKTSNINFLIQGLLTLSKFDANTINFNYDYHRIKDIFNEVLDNVGALSDLKMITINIKGNSKDKLYCDYKWQIEALTNIVKNCIEHSKENSKIDISYLENDLFYKIVIKDYGTGMDEEDRKNIFKRFYKGKNQSKDSIGIGMSLAKTIIEKNNGYITVDSKLNEGTTFTIKYLK